MSDDERMDEHEDAEAPEEVTVLRPRRSREPLTRSWWAGRWVHALTQLIDPGRLARGRSYERRRRVMELDIQVGLIRARVQGTMEMPYRVRIEVQTLREADWQRAIAAMAGEARYAAQLLTGEMPHDIEDVFSRAGVSLFPVHRGELNTHCTCPDPVNPCKHIAAAFLAVGERLDEDPFLMFQLRGRTHEQVMAALREARADIALGPVAPAESAPHPEAGDAPLSESLERFWRMGPQLGAMQVHVAPPEVELEAIKVLGDPSFAEDETLLQRLSDVYRSVSNKAVEVAFGEHDDESDPSGQEPMSNDRRQEGNLPPSSSQTAVGKNDPNS